MTTTTDIKETLAKSIEESHVGSDNAFSWEESLGMSEELLGGFLVMEKSALPEANVMDTMIYAGSQAIPATSKPDDILERALAFLAAAAKLTDIQAEAKKAQEKSKKELLDIINEFTRSSPNNVASYESMTNVEILAASEIRKLRLDLEASRLVKVVHAG